MKFIYLFWGRGLDFVINIITCIILPWSHSFLFQFHALYFVSFAVVILGVVVYSSRPTPTANHEHSNTNNHNTDHNKTPYYQYRPVGTLEESTRNDSDTDQLSQLSNNSHDESSTLLTSPVK